MPPDPGVLTEWLAYAHEVVGTHSPHLQWCEAHPTPTGKDGRPFPGVQWPGIVFAGYRPGDVLLVGNIHTYFDTQGLLSSVRAQEAARTVEQWRAQTIDDDQAMAVLRDVYREGLQRWRQQKRIADLMSLMGASFDRLAFFNAARCQGDKACRPHQRDCLRHWPMSRMLQILRPGVVVLASATARDHRENAPIAWPNFTVSVNPFTSMDWKLLPKSRWSRPDLIGQPFDGWAEAFTDAVLAGGVLGN